ncbi:MAG: division/cell wall cluster transcriptional repressor MraZ [Chloroflexota bacterium]
MRKAAPSVFTGEYRHTLDGKGRLAVPARFRAQLEDGPVVSRWIDGCLAIHTRTGWDALAEKIAALPITDAASRLFGRSIFAGASETEIDRQGRILLPSYLREGIGLEGEAVVVGSRDHAEIWAPATWADYRRAMDDPAAFAQAIQGLGI